MYEILKIYKANSNIPVDSFLFLWICTLTLIICLRCPFLREIILQTNPTVLEAIATNSFLQQTGENPETSQQTNWHHACFLFANSSAQYMLRKLSAYKQLAVLKISYLENQTNNFPEESSSIHHKISSCLASFPLQFNGWKCNTSRQHTETITCCQSQPITF